MIRAELFKYWLCVGSGVRTIWGGGVGWGGFLNKKFENFVDFF